MYLSKPRFLTAVLSLALCSIAHAAIRPTRCNACTESQYQALAYNKAVAAHQATGYQYVYDMTYSNFRKFAVEREPAGGGGYTYTVYSVTPSPSESSNWAQEKAAIDSNAGHSLFYGFSNQSSSGFPVPSANSETVANTSAYRNQIGTYLVGAPSNVYLNSAVLTFDSLLNMVVGIILQSDVISCVITVHMNDGGALTYQWTAGSPTATFVSAVDADQNDIPMTIDHVPGDYVFSHDNGPAFVTYLNNKYALNISVCLNGTLACSGDGHQNYSCEWVHCGGMP